MTSLSQGKSGHGSITILAALLLTACGGGSGGGAQSSTQAGSPPTAPQLTLSPEEPAAGRAATFTAQSTDPQASAITYSWNFGDGATAVGATVAHAYQAVGTYTVTASAKNALGLSNTTSRTFQVTYGSPGTPALSCGSESTQGQSFSCSAAATDPAGLAVTYAWSFGDQTTGVGQAVTHTYAAAGEYLLQVTATNTAGRSAATSRIQLASPPTQSNVFEPYCYGTGCGAIDATTYSGAGVGIWRYDNASPTAATIPIQLNGLRQGLTVTLSFSNGRIGQASTTPSPGNAALVWAQDPAAVQTKTSSDEGPRSELERDQEGHAELLERSRRVADQVLARSGTTGSNKAAAVATRWRGPGHAATVSAVVPPIGTERTWRDLYDEDNTVSYVTQVQSTCALTTGRNAVFWLDPNATAGGFAPSNLMAVDDDFCGTEGGYAQLVALYGDVWGPHQYMNLIQDSTGARLDINVVVVWPPESVEWGGYFYSLNAVDDDTNYPDSNKALVFFVNGRDQRPELILLTLVHEAMHMINFYQRQVSRGLPHHDSWLEETSAMMVEDLLVPGLTDGQFSPGRGRAASYLQSGAGVNYTSWTSLSGDHYSIGGAFGAFLNRRYGPSLTVQVLRDCAGDSYACVDDLLRTRGGTGFADEYARMGASVFSAALAAGLPRGYGFPAVTLDDRALAGIELASLAQIRPQADAVTSYGGTTQTYHVDTIAPGQTTYARQNVAIPANTSLIVVVK